jgi:hypothetical protein
MTPIPPQPTSPPPVTSADLLRLTLEQYHRMGETGVLTPDHRVELLDGLLVSKPKKKPPHAVATELTRTALAGVIPAGWSVRVQEPITLDDSETEPDLALVPGSPRTYVPRHPFPAEVALVVEVADTSLARDRDWKKRIYARNGIAAYWIVNLVDRVLEVYADPSGPVLTPDYGTAKFLSLTDRADVRIGGTVAGTVAVADLFP